MKTETLSIKEWADRKFQEHKQTIEEYVKDGIDLKTAFHMVMESSTLGQGYKAQMRKELGLGIFN